MGKLRRIQARLSDSRLELEIAIGMSPNFGHAISQLGMTLVFLGLPEDAIPWLERSLRLAPRDPGTPVDEASLGLCHLMLGEIEDAITCLRKARAGNAQTYYVHMWLAAGLGLCGEFAEGGAALRQSIRIKPEIELADVPSRTMADDDHQSPIFYAGGEDSYSRSPASGPAGRVTRCPTQMHDRAGGDSTPSSARATPLRARTDGHAPGITARTTAAPGDGARLGRPPRGAALRPAPGHPPGRTGTLLAQSSARSPSRS